LTCSSGNTATVTDEAGVERTNTYDGLGRLKQVVENGIGSAVTSYTYDVQGNLTGVTQNGGTQTRSFGYDSPGRPRTAGNPESGTTCYGLLSGAICVGYVSGAAAAYDGNGNLLNRTDGRGIVTTMTYDALNRAAPPDSRVA
jgi:YD repeat-containing protein